MNIDTSLFDVEDKQDNQTSGGPQDNEIGIVTSTAPLKVNCSGTPENAIAMIGYTPAEGDAALMFRARGVTVLLGKTATGQVPPSLPTAPISGTTPFPAAYTFSWRDEQSTFGYETSVRQGAQDSGAAWSGAWFYQGTIAAALAGATVTAIQMKVTRASGGTPGSQAAQIFQSSTGSWPVPDLAEPPTAVGSATAQMLAVGAEAWVDLPIGVGQALVDGDAGLMLSADSPMVILTGIDTDPESGLLSISWTR